MGKRGKIEANKKSLSDKNFTNEYNVKNPSTGLFILCWLPFFTMYLIRPFCDDCINPVLFSILFWLGYCNSAVNPMIYALFSKDFRFAFKRLLCCKGAQFGRPPSSRRGSDMSQMKTGGRTPSISPSANANSLEDNSDPIDTSDSR